MKKYILKILVLFLLSQYANAQQFEWVKTFEGRGAYALNQSSLNDLCNSIKINNDILVSGLAHNAQIDLDPGFGENIFTTSGIRRAERFLTILSENGDEKHSNMVYTPNGEDGPPIINYNSFTKKIQFGFFTNSDSIKFHKDDLWILKNKKTNYIINYDTALNFINTISIYCNNLSYFNDIISDKMGNTYVSGVFKDSLIINGKLRLKSNSSISYLLKLNQFDSIEWISHSNLSRIGNYVDGKKLLQFNYSNNSVKTVLINPPNVRGVFYYQNDSFVFNNSNKFQYHIVSINSSTGEIEKLNTFSSFQNNGLTLTEIKGNDSLLLLTGFCNSNNDTLNIDNKKYNLNLSKRDYESPFLICLNANSLVHKYVQIFDSCRFYLSISDIYNDSLYNIMGYSIGNQNFDFKNQETKSSDFLSSQRVNSYLWTDFFAQYNTNNNLKYVWYLTNTNPYQSSNISTTAKILNNNGNLYIIGNINYEQELGLGKRSNKYASRSSFDISVIKYNCKPTAYFNTTQHNKTVNFKNLSSNSYSYLWQFPIHNDVATTKHAQYTFPSYGATYPVSLIVANNCGKDTFTQSITTNTNSIKNITQNFFAIAPNPCSEYCIVNLLQTFNFNKENIDIRDINGKKITTDITPIDSLKYKINTQYLSKGIYTVSIKTEYGTFAKKLVVL